MQIRGYVSDLCSSIDTESLYNFNLDYNMNFYAKKSSVSLAVFVVFNRILQSIKEDVLQVLKEYTNDKFHSNGNEIEPISLISKYTFIKSKIESTIFEYFSNQCLHYKKTQSDNHTPELSKTSSELEKNPVCISVIDYGYAKGEEPDPNFINIPCSHSVLSSAKIPEPIHFSPRKDRSTIPSENHKTPIEITSLNDVHFDGDTGDQLTCLSDIFNNNNGSNTESTYSSAGQISFNKAAYLLVRNNTSIYQLNNDGSLLLTHTARPENELSSPFKGSLTPKVKEYQPKSNKTNPIFICNEISLSTSVDSHLSVD